MIFNIQRFSTHDGAGIRTIIFYKGCPLRCQWCSNPEGLTYGPGLVYDRKLCKGFGDCIRTDDSVITPVRNGILISRNLVSDPEKFRDVCASGALTLAGQNKSITEIVAEVEKDLPFYGMEGGVTLSGGEPLAQGEDLTELLQELKKKRIDVSVETSLHVEREKVTRCMGLVNTFLVDLKHTDKDKFKAFTLGDVELVTGNLKLLVNGKEQVIIRIPVIPGFNHSEREMEQIINFAASLNNVREMHFLPYHTLGIEKYRMLGMKYKFGKNRKVPDKELTGYIQYARSKGFKTKIGG